MYQYILPKETEQKEDQVGIGEETADIYLAEKGDACFLWEVKLFLSVLKIKSWSGFEFHHCIKVQVSLSEIVIPWD